MKAVTVFRLFVAIILAILASVNNGVFSDWLVILFFVYVVGWLVYSRLERSLKEREKNGQADLY